jgi:hypothetical protein
MELLRRFYFNTGVDPRYIENPNIGFDCLDVPDGYKLDFLCDNPELEESKKENTIVREVFNTRMLSKYAYFSIHKTASNE